MIDSLYGITICPMIIVQVLLDPFYRFSKSIFKCKLRLPTAEFTSLGVIADQSHDFTFGRPDPCRILFDRHVFRAYQMNYHFDYCADGFTSAGAKVDDLPYCLIAQNDFYEALRNILDKSHIADRFQGTHIDLLKGHRLSYGGGYKSPRRLPWTKGIEWPHRYYRQFKAVVIRLYHLVRPNLACRIGGLPLQGMFLVDRNINGSTICLAGRRVHQSRYLFIHAGLQYIHGSLHIYHDIIIWSHIAIRYPDQRCQMKNVVTTLDGFPYKEGVPNVAEDRFDAFLGFRRQVCKHTPVAATVVFDKCRNSRPFLK